MLRDFSLRCAHQELRSLCALRSKGQGGTLFFVISNEALMRSAAHSDGSGCEKSLSSPLEVTRKFWNVSALLTCVICHVKRFLSALRAPRTSKFLCAPFEMTKGVYAFFVRTKRSCAPQHIQI